MDTENEAEIKWQDLNGTEISYSEFYPNQPDNWLNNGMFLGPHFVAHFLTLKILNTEKNQKIQIIQHKIS